MEHCVAWAGDSAEVLNGSPITQTRKDCLQAQYAYGDVASQPHHMKIHYCYSVIVVGATRRSGSCLEPAQCNRRGQCTASSTNKLLQTVVAAATWITG